MKKLGYGLWLLIVVGCGTSNQQQPEIKYKEHYLKQEEVFFKQGETSAPRMILNGCSTSDAYVPDTNYLNLTPTKFIKVNFHWVNSSDSSKNYFGKEAIEFTKGLLHSANKDLLTNNRLWFPYRNKTPIIPPQIQYRLTSQKSELEDDGIYFHYDDQLCYYIHKGRTRNLFDKRIFQRYSVDPDSILNIFIMPHHPDSVASSTYLAGGVGVALGKAIKMAGMYENGGPSWNYRGVLNHEVGHIFSLVHAWVRNDGCNDTPPHNASCWNRTEEPPCDTMATNNMMDYNALQNALTPCQIGRIQKTITTLGSNQRALVEPNWCKLKSEKPIVIRDSLELNGARDLEHHLIIGQNASLVINCRVSLPPSATITIRPGGHLILKDNAILHNACGKMWNGIIIQENETQKGKVTIIGNARIENHQFKLDR